MKRIWALFFTLSLFATTITGIYIPPEGEKPEGVKISIGKYSFKTGRGGFFFRSGVPTGTYPLRVKGKDFGKINVRGEILRLWIDGVEGIFYITRNFPSLPPQTVKKEEYYLKDDLELSPALQAYQGSLHFQGLTEQEFFLQGLRIPSLSSIPYALTRDLKIEVGYPGAEVKVKEEIPPRPSSRMALIYGNSSKENLARALSFPYMEGEIGIYRGDYGGFVSFSYGSENFSSPDEQKIEQRRGFASLFFRGIRVFLQEGKDVYTKLRERPYFSPSSSRNGEGKDRGYGLNLSWKGLSLSLGNFSWERNLSPETHSPYFIFDEVLRNKQKTNYSEFLKKKVFSFNSSLLFYSSSFLGLNNTFFLGGEFFLREVQGNRDFPAELSLYDGKPGFLYLKTPDIFRYRNYSAGISFSDTITSGNVNIYFSAGYRAQWFKTSSSKSQDREFSGISVEGIEVPSFTSKVFHIFATGAGISYDPFRNGFLIIRIYGSYRGTPIPESLIHRISSSMSYGKYLWQDDGDLLPEEGEFSPLYQYVAQASLKDVPLYASSLGPSRFYRLGAGVSSDLPLGLSADFDLFYTKTTLPIVDIPLVWKDGQWKLVSWGDWEEGGEFPMQYGGQKWFQLEEGKYFNGYYETLNLESVERSWKEMSLRLRRSGKISFVFQVNIRSSLFFINEKIYPLDPGNLNFTINQPWGPYPNGQYRSPLLASRWGIYFSLSWAPKQWNFRATFRARDGFVVPVYYLDTSQLRAGLYDYPMGLAAPLSEFRLPTFWRLDLNAGREFSLGYFKAHAFVRITNLLNSMAPAEEYENALSPDFLSPRWYYPPRQILLGIILSK